MADVLGTVTGVLCIAALFNLFRIFQAVFRSAVGNLGPRSLTCFIDALDECDGLTTGLNGTATSLPLRIWSSSWLWPWEDQEIQFIHELCVTPTLRSTCVKPAYWRTRRELLEGVHNFPFLEYANRCVFITPKKLLPQHDFLRDFALKPWIYILNIFAREDEDYVDDESIIYILARNNWAELICTAVRHKERFDFWGSPHRHPLAGAMVNRNRDAIKALFSQDASLQETTLELVDCRSGFHRLYRPATPIH
ncbi:hypothetical protein EDB80DRAFT_692794 [Ilyonectria destructans]|nr:hypothetical protein EDB80DRAFT_692794 [Ilyonectria destructans]